MPTKHNAFKTVDVKQLLVIKDDGQLAVDTRRRHFLQSTLKFPTNARFTHAGSSEGLPHEIWAR